MVDKNYVGMAAVTWKGKLVTWMRFSLQVIFYKYIGY